MPPLLHTNSIVPTAPHPSALAGSHLSVGEGFSLSRRAFTSIFTVQMLEVGGRGVPRPYSASPGDMQEFGSVHPLRPLR